MTDNNINTLNGFNAMDRSLSNGSNTTFTNLHSLWSDYVNQERYSLVQEHPQIDRKVLGGFISNVLMKIAQNQDKGEENPDDEWQTALLSELSALHEYYPSGFGIFAEFVSRVIRRASNNGQASSSPYRPLGSPDSRRDSVFSDTRSSSPPTTWHEQRLPPIINLQQARASSPDLPRHYSSAPLSPPKSASPSSNPEEYHYATTQPSGHYARLGTDPHLFSLESSSYLARPSHNTNGSMASPPQLPMKRPAEDYPLRQYTQPEESSVAAILNEANALSTKLGNMAATTERNSQGQSTGSANGEGRSLACLRCRRKKTRCNHDRPTCSRCAHSGFTCEYPEPLPKPTDMASSIAKLQGQLKLLNSKIQSEGVST